jgi:poly(beta-D-mannuronate) lyase
MAKSITTILCILLLTICKATIVKVADIKSLQIAESNAKPGDTIVLNNGIWKDVILKINCKGTEKAPIIFKAETPGKVVLSNKSCLKVGGNFVIIDGLNFRNGYSPESAIIILKTDNNNVANNCRITNCLIDDFNKPKRLDEDYWVSFYGKKNRIDHCTFRNKKNLGVLMAVILDDEKSRENFHSIDHNFFDGRPPLGSNAGEIIRVGVSQHCTFSSNTIIADNYFKNCDGETEIISLKSCDNIIKNNVFKECQGCVTLRHGNNNTVFNNIFLGNGKEGTGGVRIINEGNWVVNNLFYECVGVSFRSPLAIMNGVPNSPAFRYLPVKDAVVFGNSFINCTPFSLCEGSDKERSQVPQNVLIANNVFYNKKDTTTFYQFDSINGFVFKDNLVSESIKQNLPNGFKASTCADNPICNTEISSSEVFGDGKIDYAKLENEAKNRIGNKWNYNIGFGKYNLTKSLSNTQQTTGITWKEDAKTITKTIEIQCANSIQLFAALGDSINNNKQIKITLTGIIYELKTPIKIYNQVVITSNKKEIKFITQAQEAVFIIQGNASLNFTNANIDASFIKATNFVSSPTNGSVNHYKFSFINSSFSFYDAVSNASFFRAAKASYADSLIFKNNTFSESNINILAAQDEIDKKGYYSAENIKFINNKFINNKGTLLGISRTGNDESTMGPKLWFTNNTIQNTNAEKALIELYGVQYSSFENNSFINSNNQNKLIEYTDVVRAIHIQSKNKLTNSGTINQNQFLINK